MFGLEKEDKKEKFLFDLEEEIKKNPSKGREIVQKTHTRVEEIKKLLHQGLQEEEFEKFGTLLHGYSVLQRVIKRLLKPSKK